MTADTTYMDAIYETETGEDMRQYYNQWAGSYDAELTDNAYATPGRIAAALARFLADRTAPVLDFACGTGMSGLAMAGAGFTVIDGMDISEGMLEQARAKGVYRKLIRADPEARLDVRGEGYAAITAVGAIGAGAAPGHYIDDAIASLAPGGLFVVSLNDHTLEDPAFEARLTDRVADGTVERLMAEDGPHLPQIDLGARVWVVRRL